MAASPIKIIECTRCQAPQVFKPDSVDLDIPVALELSLDGGYAMFVDNIYFEGEENPLSLMLCHKCAHEFTQFMGIPETTVFNWHQNTGEEYCNGWTKEWFDEQYNKQLAYVKDNWHKHFNTAFPNN